MIQYERRFIIIVSCTVFFIEFNDYLLFKLCAIMCQWHLNNKLNNRRNMCAEAMDMKHKWVLNSNYFYAIYNHKKKQWEKILKYIDYNYGGLMYLHINITLLP